MEPDTRIGAPLPSARTFPKPMPALQEGRDLWVFGFGSLMWDPGFVPAEQRPATVYGFHRRFCLYSIRYRGTAEAPGLVFGLDRGGACRGIAFRVAAESAGQVLAGLWQREMGTGGYSPRFLAAHTGARHAATPDDPRPGVVEALAFVIDPSHPQYCRGLDDETTAGLICRSHGERGPNWEYLVNTLDHLHALGIRDRSLERLLHLVEARLGRRLQPGRHAAPFRSEAPSGA